MARRKAATGKDFCWNRRHVLLGPAGRCATTVTQGRRRPLALGKRVLLWRPRKKDGNIGDASTADDERSSEQAKLHARLPFLDQY
uniref:Uncharacterized protein n=1 Tax=Aegilops tauschii TaxID=37682 RepID=N1R4Q9_AEGTA